MSRFMFSSRPCAEEAKQLYVKILFFIPHVMYQKSSYLFRRLSCLESLIVVDNGLIEGQNLDKVFISQVWQWKRGIDGSTCTLVCMMRNKSLWKRSNDTNYYKTYHQALTLIATSTFIYTTTITTISNNITITINSTIKLFSNRLQRGRLANLGNQYF